MVCVQEGVQTPLFVPNLRKSKSFPRNGFAIPLRTQEQRSSGLAPVHKLFVPIRNGGKVERKVLSTIDFESAKADMEYKNESTVWGNIS